MRLRTLESFWLLKNGLLTSYSSLLKDENTELVVIGGGITGALVSYALVQKGHKVILLDKRDIGMGSTSATTSMLQYEVDVPLYELSEMIGEEAAAECYRAGIQAIKELHQMVETEAIECGFERKQSLYTAREEKDVDWLKKEYEMRNRHHLGVQWLEPESIFEQFGVKSQGGILSETAASVDAYALAHKLIEISVKRGMRVFDQTEIKDFEFKNDKAIIHTSEGLTVTCDKIIFCNGYEATELLKEKICKLHYTYACISEQGCAYHSNLNKTLVWDTGNPYYYMRTTDDQRILIGGEDMDFNLTILQNTIKKARVNKLMDHLKEIMPGIRFIEDFSWGGTFGSTKDGLPYIGASPEYTNALFALGYGGNGIVFSVQAMKIITDLLEGKKNRLSHYYRFGR